LITGTLLFRDTQKVDKDKRLYVIVGQLWIPVTATLKPEHTYSLIGSEYECGESELIKTIGLQILLNSEKDISSVSTKKHPSQLVPLLYTPLSGSGNKS
jgi:hypothetical protein